MENNIASSAEAEIGTETIKTVLLTPARYKELLSTLESLQRENEVLRDALSKISDGYGPNHMSTFCRYTAKSALSSTGDAHGN